MYRYEINLLLFLSLSLLWQSCKLTTSFKKLDCDVISKHILANYYPNDVVFTRDTLLIKLKVSEKDALEVCRLIITEYCILYDLKEMSEMFKHVRFIHDTPEEEEKERMDFPKSHVKYQILDYSIHLNKYKLHRYIIDKVDSDMFHRVEKAYQHFSRPNQKLDPYDTFYVGMANEMVENCSSARGDAAKENLLEFKNYIDGLNTQTRDDPYITDKELILMDSIINFCDRRE